MSILDAYFSYEFSPLSTIGMGLMKAPFSKELLAYAADIDFMNRARTVDFLAPKREIGLRTVRIVTPDDSLVSIPNSEIVNQAVSNSNSGEFNCQVVAEFYLPANIDMVVLKKIAYRAAAVSRYVYLKKPIAVIIKNEIHEGRSVLKVRLKAYVLDLRYEFAFASEMTELVIQYLLQKKIVHPEELSFINTSAANV